MANVEKKENLFSMLSFCFAKSDLRVWEDIWEKSSRKMNDIVEKTLKLFAFKKMILSRKLATKKWRTNIGIFFVIQHAVFLLNVFLQQSLKLMSKMENTKGGFIFSSAKDITLEYRMNITIGINDTTELLCKNNERHGSKQVWHGKILTKIT